MTRTYVVTGSASGIGAAARELLVGQGHRVIGADLHDADIIADLGSPRGRRALVDEVSGLTDVVDGVLSIAGLVAPTPATVSVNYFGMVGVLEGIRPLLRRSSAPRAVGVASVASIRDADDMLVEAMLADDEPRARDRAIDLARDSSAGLGGGLIYASSKRAFARWLRRTAGSERWAGAGIPLNAIAPGIVQTPMTESGLATEAMRSAMHERTPMPLNGFAEPAVPARLMAWLAGVENSHVCGQIVFVDGGADVTLRGDSAF